MDDSEPGADLVVPVYVGDTIQESHGHKKQGTAYGYSRVKDLTAQPPVISTPLVAPIVSEAGSGKVTRPWLMGRAG